jgi:hypothetical protein
MAQKSVKEALGQPSIIRIDNIGIELHPIRIKDWPEASKLIYLLDFESLADIAYIEGLSDLKALIQIVGRASEKDKLDWSIIEDMTDEVFKTFRELTISQNDIDLKRVLAKVASVAGDQKN